MRDMKDDESRGEHLKGMLSIINPVLYSQVFSEEVQAEEEGESVAIETDDFGDIDAFLNKIDGVRVAEEKKLFTDWM